MMKKRTGRAGRIAIWIFAAVFLITASAVLMLFIRGKLNERELEAECERMMESYGENRKIEDGSYDKSLAAVCRNGTFVGQEKNGVVSFKGIPYATPPVGDRRWKRPLPAEDDDSVYEAYYYGKSGIQTKAESERASLYMQGEDCLTLNVWTGSVDKTSGRPVMVFFPGGGYGWGGTADPLYDGQNFAEVWKDIVLVTVNYRIGLMGFMDFSEVAGGEDFAESGNLGLLDQICALKWIRENIAGFGGDPEQVTIFGESAGASSVSLLPLIGEARGLFRRAIAQSGSVAFTYSREECLSLTRKLLKLAGASSMDELMALDEAELMKLNESLNDFNNFPERDGIILPEDLYGAYRNGDASWADLLIGSNADEARYWIGEVGGYLFYLPAGSLMYKSTVNRISPEDRHFAEDFMRMQKGKLIWKRTQFLNELLFRIPAASQAALHADSGGNTYMYYWTKESAIPNYGACHAAELSYVFNNLDDTIFTGERADASLAAAVQAMWVSFAKTGDPSAAGYVWEKYDSDTRKTMFLGDEIRQVSDPMKEERELIEPLLPYRFNGYYGVYEYAKNYAGRELLLFLKYVLIIDAVIAAAYFISRRFLRNKRHS